MFYLYQPLCETVRLGSIVGSRKDLAKDTHSPHNITAPTPQQKLKEFFFFFFFFFFYKKKKKKKKKKILSIFVGVLEQLYYEASECLSRDPYDFQRLIQDERFHIGADIGKT